MDVGHFKKKLLEEREKLTKDLSFYKSEDPYSDPERTVPSAASDEASGEIESHDRISATRSNLKQDLREVEGALGRIENGKYGVCLNCGKKINLERLEIFPAARFCQGCSRLR
ncbi:MAG: hypothetical protein A2134_02160 [Candidatus Woykebacteria bacterium RBG_16_39_9b]|uniref:Zinc finger DksA/TraR C4-type domain-containing protein n=1 Tax=Candidatus Woykebacteria bacterium RBG_16_39_9b TaxID=1802595 RepID=A0A1G1WCA9_9BACT|nr:MAG: hypothetical protein A2134_02160 [Candidatus Woykebacteria bacterium RBG_16_39_9b]